MLFQDRAEAGRRLAKELEAYRGQKAIVLALPRGGVVIGSEVARALDLPLDVLIVRKIGAPGNPEWGIGAIAENGNVQLDEGIIQALGIPRRYLDQEIRQQKAEIERRRELYRDGGSLPDLENKIVIVVDDGVATGYTALAAVRAARAARPKKLVVAVPVASVEASRELRKEVDEFIVLETPEPFIAVSRFYWEFEQVSDQEVKEYLDKLKLAHLHTPRS
ncbi:MAG: phosphoribosyltransferase [Chloroflexi bacterium]|nr:phosphoribosyltransferase [Chloroflexota bacterium]